MLRDYQQGARDAAISRLHIPTAEYLRECFDYNPNTGRLMWKERPLKHFKNKRYFSRFKKMYAGKTAGTLMPDGYIVVRVNRTGYQASRVIWAMIHGAFPTEQIDHINHYRSDNRICNLREATSTENNRNRTLANNNTSGFVGVTWSRRQRKYKAMIGLNGVQKYLGYFDTKNDAKAAYIAEAKRIGFHPNHGKEL